MIPQVGRLASQRMRDNSLKKPKFKSDNENYNLKNQLLKENKINKDFLEKLNFLTLEDLITLKLDSANKSLKGKLFNFPILKYATDICQESVIKYALSVSKNRREASLILGKTKAELSYYIKKYNILLKQFYLEYETFTRKLASFIGGI